MNIDLVVKNARNVHIREMANHLKNGLRALIDHARSYRDEFAKTNEKDCVDMCNDYINAYMKVWDMIDAYVKLEKR